MLNCLFGLDFEILVQFLSEFIPFLAGGEHGYNNTLTSMHPFFIAHGPAFKKKYTSPPFRNVDVFPLICHLLQIPIPSNIDGSLEDVKNMLQEQHLTTEALRKYLFKRPTKFIILSLKMQFYSAFLGTVILLI